MNIVKSKNGGYSVVEGGKVLFSGTRKGCKQFRNPKKKAEVVDESAIRPVPAGK